MLNYILIITSSYDRTVDYIIEKHPNEKFFRFDVDKFSDYSVSAHFGEFTISSATKTISNKNCLSIYYRKPSLEDLSGVISPEYFGFIYKEVFALIDGVADSFEGLVLTRPSILRASSNKITQSSLAHKIGFKTPKHTITNCHQKIKTYFSSDIIVKPISTGKIKKGEDFEYVQTNLVDDSVSFEKLKYCPSYFQKYIEKDYECRLTVIENCYFPVRIISKNKVDWRVNGNSVDYSCMDIPEDIIEKCYKLMSSLNIEFGCFDFIIKNEEWYFLEVNINGQWAWLEMDLGIKISDKIIQYLKGV